MKTRWIVRGDIDGFFGLFIDNLLQLMLIKVLCEAVCGLPAELITGRILPGAAVSILIGNLFYARQARRLMRETGRTDVTALPYGINTPSLIAYIFLIMAPVYHDTKDPTLAWQVGLAACFLSGAMEFIGAFVGDWLRRNTPRAALLSALAGIAITFISMGFVFRIFANPLIALLPTMLILVTYASRISLPFGVPGGLLAIAVGTGLAWLLRLLGFAAFDPAPEAYALRLHLPRPVPGDLFALLSSEQGWRYMAVIFPMGLFNVVGSLQNLESAEAAGDRYETRSSLAVNGVGSMAAALFGSPFPTTIYIGHPAWKAMGARAAYSTLNGIVITALCLLGGVTLVLRIVPIEVTLGILLWIGIIITAQAFQEVPKGHALAVAIGLLPSLAAWGLILVDATARAAGAKLKDLVGGLEQNDVFLHGVISLNQGFILISMILSAMLALIVDRRFRAAAGWSVVAAALSYVGVIHAYTLTEGGVRNCFGLGAAPAFALVYALNALVLLWLHRRAAGGAADGTGH